MQTSLQSSRFDIEWQQRSRWHNSFAALLGLLLTVLQVLVWMKAAGHVDSDADRVTTFSGTYLSFFEERAQTARHLPGEGKIENPHFGNREVRHAAPMPASPEKALPQDKDATISSPTQENTISDAASPAVSAKDAGGDAVTLNIDSQAIAKAYKDSRSDIQKMADSAGKSLKAPYVSKYDTFQVAAAEAAKPYCFSKDGDALKHDPPKIGPVNLGGIYALPFFVHAVITGKCK